MGDDSPPPIAKLPDHVLIEIFIRVPIVKWGKLSCVNKYWAELFRHDSFLWYAALITSFPLAAPQPKTCPGPITVTINRITKRRFIALYTSKCIFGLNDDDDELSEIVGHTYMFLKEQLQISTMPPSSGILHGTIIDQFIACGKSRDRAHELASMIWLAVVDNLEESDQTFVLLKRVALEGDVFLPHPYSRSYRVEWKIFERLFTDFRDCLHDSDYYDLLGCAKQKFQPIPASWLGY